VEFNETINNQKNNIKCTWSGVKTAYLKTFKKVRKAQCHTHITQEAQVRSKEDQISWHTNLLNSILFKSKMICFLRKFLYKKKECTKSTRSHNLKSMISLWNHPKCLWLSKTWRRARLRRKTALKDWFNWMIISNSIQIYFTFKI